MCIPRLEIVIGGPIVHILQGIDVDLEDQGRPCLTL
jgi:hypothetical protein